MSFKKYSIKFYPEMRLLKGYMKRKGITYGEMASKLGIREHTFFSKINGYSCFNLSEVAAMGEILKLSNADTGKLMLADFDASKGAYWNENV